ncbi:unnamed protein product [Owenia fusiformis]|uniref:Large ribosomal subunit protein bL28m n=1 Tax=Owenia fusiformis TaxID=6347 RepID=A0A8S4N651_OWEFU|nr:unnamed protein product [Owenia fusiformis]
MASKIARAAASSAKKKPWKHYRKWDEGARASLPEHYQERHKDLSREPPKPVHDLPPTDKYWYNESSGKVFKTVYQPILTKQTKDRNKGLWGGENIIEGYTKKNPIRRRVPHFWIPRLQKRPLYSEILDRWMEITVTLRTLDLIDDAYGFDHYILGTHERDLQSQLGKDLKREMIQALVNKTLYPQDEEKREKIYKRYQKYIEGITPEEAEWIGLSVGSAIRKQKNVERAQQVRDMRPFKELFTRQLVETLKDAEERGDVIEPHKSVKKSNWMSKINPFQSKGS